MSDLYKLIFILVIFGSIGFLLIKSYSRSWKKVKGEFPAQWRKTLLEKVNYYLNLDQNDRQKFETRVHEFLLNTKIIGIKTSVTDDEKVLIAAGAVIPLFAFEHYRYPDLNEVLVYEKGFNDDYQTDAEDNNILGMVGSGYMNGKMLLSKQTVRHGFANDSDKENTVIHEFVHLIDKEDGYIDGFPAILVENDLAIPWFDLIDKKINEIRMGESDIRLYGGVNRQEFLSVASEYFFERPHLMKEKNPQLYELMSKIFKQDRSDTFKILKRKKKLGRNDPCPCGSGKKYKNCCMRFN